MESCVLSRIEGVPSALYKYVSTRRALEILLTRKIYFAHRKELNDPLDGKLSGRKDEKVETRLKGSRSNLVKDLAKGLVKAEDSDGYQDKLDAANLGFFSMSTKWNSYPMWAHYADQHRGCCLMFDFSRLQSRYNWKECFPFVFVGKMGYAEQEELPGIDIAKKCIPHETGSIYMTKHNDWGYEDEWRAVMYNGAYKPFGEVLFDSKCLSCQDMQGRNLYKLKEKFLEGIILGYKMQDSEREAVKVAAIKCGIKIMKTNIESI